MTNIELMEKALPTAPLKIAALESCKDLAEKVDQYIVSFRKNSLHDFLDPAIYSSYEADSYLAKNSCPRFGSGEAKGMFGESIRGKDLFIMVDGLAACGSEGDGGDKKDISLDGLLTKHEHRR